MNLKRMFFLTFSLNPRIDNLNKTIHLLYMFQQHEHHHTHINDRCNLVFEVEKTDSHHMNVIQFFCFKLPILSISNRSINLCNIECVWNVMTQSKFRSFCDHKTAPSIFLYSCRRKWFLHSCCM